MPHLNTSPSTTLGTTLNHQAHPLLQSIRAKQEGALSALIACADGIDGFDDIASGVLNILQENTMLKARNAELELAQSHEERGIPMPCEEKSIIPQQSVPQSDIQTRTAAAPEMSRRERIVSRRLRGMGNAAIAEELQLTEKAVTNTLHQTRERIRRHRTAGMAAPSIAGKVKLPVAMVEALIAWDDGEISLPGERASYSPAFQAKLLTMWADGHRPCDIARELNIPSSTLYNSIARDKATLGTMLEAGVPAEDIALELGVEPATVPGLIHRAGLQGAGVAA